MKVERRSCRQNIESTLLNEGMKTIFVWSMKTLSVEDTLILVLTDTNWKQKNLHLSCTVCGQQEMEHPKCRLQEAKSKLKKSFIAEH